MQATEFETDQMLKLLTEALRRGPASPQWHEALEQLRHSGAQDADDYRLLMTVRQRLESGQTYRQVRAGPGFTRDLFQKIAAVSESANNRGRTAVCIALICAAVLIGSIAIILQMMTNGQTPSVESSKLAQTLFVSSVRQWDFNSEMPEEVLISGALKLQVQDGLRAARQDATADATVTSPESLDLSTAVCVEAQVQFQPNQDVRIEIGVAPENTLAAAGGVSILLQDKGFVVTQGQTFTIDRSLQSASYTVRIKLDASHAMIDVNGQPVWSGTHTVESPVNAFIRLYKDGKRVGDSRVKSLRILRP